MDLVETPGLSLTWQLIICSFKSLVAQSGLSFSSSEEEQDTRGYVCAQPMYSLLDWPQPALKHTHTQAQTDIRSQITEAGIHPGV